MLVRSVVMSRRVIGQTMCVPRVRGGELLLLDSPPAVMCKDCGDVQAVSVAPVSERDWQSVAQRFHCVCEVG